VTARTGASAPASTVPAGPPVAVWADLLDDAALFPPGDAPMRTAVPAHRGHRAGRHSPMVGAFLVPTGRLAELAGVLDDTDSSSGGLDVGIIAPAEALREAVAAVLGHPRLTLAAVEVSPSAVPADRVAATVRAAVPDGVPVAVEVPRDDRRAAVLDALVGAGMRAKLRTGGVAAPAFPPEAELAAALTGCRDRGVAFKATAGLHRAVRHRDDGTGFVHHGYLNLLLAADTAARGGEAPDIAEVLAERDVAAVTAGVVAMAPGSARWAAARALFASFGTCSIHEPVADLEALGLLGTPDPETTT
jgi:hypothetical protein